MSCQNNLRQIALGAELFEGAHRSFPAARYQPRPGDETPFDCGGKETTWLVRIMPFLEARNLEVQWDYSIPYGDHAENVRVANLSTYICPSRRSLQESFGAGLVVGSETRWLRLPCGCRVPISGENEVVASGAVGDYGGNHGDLSPGNVGLPTDFLYGGNGSGVIISVRAKCSLDGKPITPMDKVSRAMITDGSSNTILAGEMHVPLGRITQAPYDAFIFNGDHVFNTGRLGGPAMPIARNLRGESDDLVRWGSWHPGICNFAFADGSVHALSVDIDTETLGNLSNRADGNP